MHIKNNLPSDNGAAGVHQSDNQQLFSDHQLDCHQQQEQSTISHDSADNFEQLQQQQYDHSACFNGRLTSEIGQVEAKAGANEQSDAQTQSGEPSFCPSLGNSNQQVLNSCEINSKCPSSTKEETEATTHHHHNDDQEEITILHFNDCYNVEAGPKSGGAAGFLTAINQYKHLNPIILFSGDILSPSFMSTFTKGEQMIPVLNDIGVHCAVFGNHEFDYGVDNLIEFVKRTTFPWLLSNVIDKETSNQLGDGQVFHVIERSGVKFGLIGLIEEEWLSTLSTLDSSDVIYQDFVSRGRELARWLKSEPHNVDYVIALTHFRTPNDIRLAENVPEIDLILGGHDHDYEVINRFDRYIIKSGTDFREFSKIKLKLNKSEESKKSSEVLVRPPLELDVERIETIGHKPDENLHTKLQKFVNTIDEKMGKVLGQFNCELDGRFSSIRKSETNLGNFVTDIMLASTHADLAILNSGTLRSDRIHPRGEFTMRDLFNILGYIDPIAVLSATGYHVWRALENGVSQWPKLEGRFPQISGCSFIFDPSKPPMQRIDPTDIVIGDEQMVLDKKYRLTTKAYLALGKDGYDMLKECQVLVPGDESPDLTTSILNHFEAISIVKSRRRTHHRQSIICLSRGSLKKILDETGCEANMTILPPLEAAEKAFDERIRQQQLQRQQQPRTSDYDNDDNNNLASGGEASSPASTRSTSAEPPTVAATADCSPLLATPKLQAAALGASRQSTPNSSSSPLAASPALAQTPSSFRGVSDVSPSMMETPSFGQPRTKRLLSLYEMENEQCKLEPKIEGRIRIVGVHL